MSLKSIKESGDLKGKKIILRLDLNVPIENALITDDFRIQKALPILKYLQNAGAITLVISHLEGEGDKSGGGADTLEPVAKELQKYFPVDFAGDILDPSVAAKIQAAIGGSVFLFENLRMHPEECGNDENFAKQIASLGDLYVNDAFPVSHRKHASIVGVPKFLPHFAGIQMMEEIKHLSLSHDPERPFLFIIGGAKFDTKLPLIQKFLEKADYCFVGGALANDFFRAEGDEVGVSLVDNTAFDKSLINHPKLILPVDVTLLDKTIKKPEELKPNEKIMDAGPETIKKLEDLSKTAKLIIWNGPLGDYEEGFTEPTLDLANILAESTATTIIGGGDTVAAIQKLNNEDKFTFVSTGGGAMLEFLLNDTLPGIEALKK